ncbi:MAG: NAD-dependent epimerase/dehydratase family protein [Candidatus Latescibacteria bacterium]|nr:NAD-dependent epimerase/dehydratase family protein [Candidatus Latescibacterota bacterium]
MTLRICVVGGTGNISASFVKLLLQQGHEVTCYNRGKSGPPPEGARVIHGDRKDREVFERTIQAEQFDAAIDMICFNREDAESSVRAFRGVRHFIQCSTVCTYGIAYDWLPVTEDHPLRPITSYGQGKVEADAAFMEAYYREGFPVTIIKPSTTYGPKMGMLRQAAWESAWIDRIRKGKPILVCGDGSAIHQFLHVDDAALCFANVVGKERCIGQIYNMVNRGFISWDDYHRLAMKVLGKEVDLVGVPLADLLAVNIPNVGICRDIFAHNTYYSAEKLFRDVPEFRPTISLEEGMRQVIAVMDREGRVPDSDQVEWEDRVITAQREVRKVEVA